MATFTGAMSEDGLDWNAVGMKDPEGNEFPGRRAADAGDAAHPAKSCHADQPSR